VQFALFGIDDPDLNAAVVAAFTALLVLVVTLPIKEWVRLVVESKLHERKADTDYLVEQRKALATVIAAHHGRFVDAADRFCHRLVRVTRHADDHWLNPDRPGSDRYFYDSTLFRFVAVVSAAEALEREALVIDRQVGQESHLRLIWYARALRWSLTAAELFDGTGYDANEEEAHFFTDTFRDMSASMWSEGEQNGFGALRPKLQGDATFETARRFFYDAQPGELRWDRLMAARLILMGFLNDFGDDVQASSQDWFDGVAREIRTDRVATNLAEWLPRFKLESQPIQTALERRIAGSGEARE
jgi:hypothetical protein